MAKVEVVEKSADVVVDKDGRVLKLRELSILEESRLVRALGESAMNPAYMAGYVLPAAMVGSINDDVVHVPRTEVEVEALISRIGRNSINAVLEHLQAKAESNKQEEDLKK